MEDIQQKLRDERIAREKARIDKLRQLNLKKYPKVEKQLPTFKPVTLTKKQMAPVKNLASNRTNPLKTGTKGAGDATVNITKKIDNKPNKLTDLKVKKEVPKPKPVTVQAKTVATVKQTVNVTTKLSEKAKPEPNTSRRSMLPVSAMPRPADSRKSLATTMLSRKSMVSNKGQLPLKEVTVKDARKTLMPKISESRESVFDRLYKPKMVTNKNSKAEEFDKQKMISDVNYREKIIKQANLVLNKKRQTVFESRALPKPPVRRSISAVHFKRINKSELQNCFHRWASSENVSQRELKGDEDEGVKQDKVVSAIKSDRKKVVFKKPISMNFNTPKHSELQTRLKDWLQRRGKAVDTYHHLQCFGLHHMAQGITQPQPAKQIDEENKENIALSDSDNESYSELMGQKWRRTSGLSSADLNETKETLSELSMHNVDDLVIGALNDLTDLLREGFDWEQCARWLRAIRERFPAASDAAAYWECRAALEERQGNLPASVQCWEEAIAKGTERSVVEANLDQLLDKFMQLKISPRSAKKKIINPKLVDVKNVFKGTIIRFAVQQAKIRQSERQTQAQPKYTITPVRRSTRVSVYNSASKSGRTPLVQICSSIRGLEDRFRDAEFVRNGTLPLTP